MILLQFPSAAVVAVHMKGPCPQQTQVAVLPLLHLYATGELPLPCHSPNLSFWIMCGALFFL